MVMAQSVNRSIHLVLQVISLVLAISIAYRHFLGDNTSDPYKCQALESGGKWVGKHRGRYSSDKYLQWQPPGCRLHPYCLGEINACLEGERLLFIGDSGIRQLFFSTAKKLDRRKTMPLYLSADRHSNLTFEHRGVTLDFIWDPYLNSSLTQTELQHYKSGTSRPDSAKIGAVLLGTGLWQAKNLGAESLSNFKQSIDGIVSALPAREEHIGIALPYNQRKTRDSIFFTPTPMPMASKLDVSRVDTMSPQRIQAMNEYLRQKVAQSQIEVLWSYSVMTWLRPSAFEEDGFHVVENVAERFVDVFLNVRCNGAPKMKDGPLLGSCCRSSKPVNLVQRALLLAAVLTASASLYLLTRTPQPELIEKTEALQQNPHMFKTTQCLVIAAAALYCFCADRTLLFDRFEKVSSQSMFLKMVSVAGLAGLFMIRRSDGTARSAKVVRIEKPVNFMSRQQTEEWKGWMQFGILFYHYTGMSQVLWVYQVVRVMVASYLFMTGYGHTLYFLKTNDFSVRRVTAVLVRLNLLSCLLAFLMGTDYAVYYFPAITSFWFLVIYLTLRIQHQPNTVPTLLTLKTAISAVMVQFLLRIPGLLEALFSIAHNVFQTHVDVRELRFRLLLDSVVVYAGIFAAILCSQLTGGLPCSTTCAATKLLRFPVTAQVSAVALSLVVLPIYFYLVQSFHDKAVYNLWHPWISPFPVLAFVVLRNASQPLRDFHSLLFAWLGRFSLETFILQYHIWLATDTKTLLSLGLWTRSVVVGRSWSDSIAWTLDFALVTAVFIWTSWGVARATGYFATILAYEKWSPPLRGIPKHIAMRKSSNKLQHESPLPSSSHPRGTSVQLETGLGFSSTATSMNEPGKEDETANHLYGPAQRLMTIALLMAVGNWLYF